MSRVAYVDGAYVPHDEAMVHIEDRGYQFSDAVYEGLGVMDGKILDEDGHLDRFDRSLRELRIENPYSRGALKIVLRELIRRNRVTDGLLYFQMSRGVAPRDHAFPTNPVSPVLVVTYKPMDMNKLEASAQKGQAAICVPDIRWGRPDIKTVSLLANVLAKQAAREGNAYEAWMYDRDGFVTEGSSSNAWIVLADGTLVTRELSRAILPGVTRKILMEVISEAGLKVEERAFTREEAYSAREAFVSSALAFATPIIEIDGKPVANGHPGSITLDLRRRYLAKSRATAGVGA